MSPTAGTWGTRIGYESQIWATQPAPISVQPLDHLQPPVPRHILKVCGIWKTQVSKARPGAPAFVVNYRPGPPAHPRLL